MMAKETDKTIPTLTIRADEEGAAGAVKNFAKLQSDAGRHTELMEVARRFEEHAAGRAPAALPVEDGPKT